MQQDLYTSGVPWKTHTRFGRLYTILADQSCHLFGPSNFNALVSLTNCGECCGFMRSSSGRLGHGIWQYAFAQQLDGAGVFEDQMWQGVVSLALLAPLRAVRAHARIVCSRTYGCADRGR